MSSEQQLCTCTTEGYSPECPQAFMQNGRMLHMLTDETRLRPRRYEIGPNGQQHSEANPTSANVKTSELRTEAYLKYLDTPTVAAHDEGNDYALSSEDSLRYTPQPLKAPARISNRMAKGNHFEAEEMIEDNRTVLRKFEALNVNGRSLAGYSIGGFTIDLGLAAQKVQDIAPLPPARLPKIFLDDDLNFFHHFFQGLDRMMGRATVLEIVETREYFDTTSLQLLPLIDEMIQVGYEKTDSELTIFTKKVVSSTFKGDVMNDSKGEHRILMVETNLWGFQYIECGMQCKETDLKMWLQMNYSHYRTLWFNTFKSAGVPAFALEGVQSRYEDPHGSRRADNSRRPQITSPDVMNALVAINDSLPRNEHKHRTRRGSRSPTRRRREEKPKQTTIGSIFNSKGYSR